LEFENASQRQVPVGCFNQSVLAFAAAFARRTIYLTKVRTYIFPAIKISDVDQPRNLAKSVTVEWKIPFRRGGGGGGHELTNIVDILAYGYPINIAILTNG
jgi:hypothetical protein